MLVYGRIKLTESALQDLLRAEQLLKEGERKKALEIIESISKRKELTEENKFACTALGSRIRFALGEEEKAFNKVKKVWPEILKQENLLIILDYLIIAISYFRTKSDFEGGIRVVEEYKELISILEQKIPEEFKKRYKQRKNIYYRNVGILYWYRSKFDEALNYLKQSLTLSEELQDEFSMADSLNNIGLVYWSKGDFDEAIKYYEQALSISQKLGSERRAAQILTNIGNVYANKGDLDKALEKQQHSLEIKKKLGNKKYIAITITNIGVVYQLKGEIDKALEYYEEALQKSEEINSKIDIALALNNIGNIYDLKGDLEKGIEFYEKSLKLYKELEIKEKIALLQANIGAYYSQKGEIKEANNYYKQSLEIYEELENNIGSALVIFELIQEAIVKNDLKEAQVYLDKLQQISKSAKLEVVDLRYRLAKALVYKNDSQARIRTKAIVIFEEIIEEEIIDHSLTVKAMINLCDMLIKELKLTGESELLSEIKTLLQKLQKIAEEQKSNSILAEIYRLEALLALAELDLKETRQLLQKGLDLAEEKGLENIAANIREEQNRFEEHVKLWEELQKRNATLKETLQHVKIEESVKQLQQEENFSHRKLFSLKL
ncbi:MAG: tetratricopeptide repeat protein [Asgard group archaeon]|nr:tetratricopeptide repeat protein [Asgard group archaeon]